MQRQRRPLTHVDGDESRYGDESASARLSEAFTVPEEERDAPIQGLHGIAPYPARLHPSWVRRLLLHAPPDAVVLDPFCGSGTALVEAQKLGLRSRGGDLNLMALRIARQRTAVRSPGWIDEFLFEAKRVWEESDRRRDTPFARLAKGEKRFPPHVLAQLITVRDRVHAARDATVREALVVAFGALIGKFVERPGRPAPEVGRNAVREQLLRRCEAAAEAWRAHGLLAPPVPELRLADAREQPWPEHEAAVVVTSPPYPGVYDYVEEQALRIDWCGSGEPREFGGIPTGGQSWVGMARKLELGKRGHDAGAWVHGMDAVLCELARMTRSGAMSYLIVGDGVAAGDPVRADQVIRKILHTRGYPLSRVAMVSRTRPWFHEGSAGAFSDRPRREHLIQLVRR